MIYVMSDLHGKYDWFMQMLDKINFSNEDELYIVGDVIDRGDKPIELLQYIMLHKNNIHLLLGNHEYMMLGARHNLDDRYDWKCNGGDITKKQFLKLNKEEQNDIYDFLEYECPVIIPNLVVNDINYYLVHSTPNFRYHEQKKLNELIPGDTYTLMWERRFNDEFRHSYMIDAERELFSYDGVVISGHTPMPYCWFGEKDSAGNYKISSAYDGRYINIDCGCACNHRLACLRLNDMKQFYIQGGN